MPYAVTHILIPVVIVSIIRDLQKRKFSLHYAFLAGLGGILPDIDIIISLFLKSFGVINWDIHKTITHTLIFPVIFLLLALATKPINSKAKLCNIGRHKLKIYSICLVIAFGIFTHIALDTIIGGESYLFKPWNNNNYAIDIFNWVSNEVYPLVFPLLDGFIFIFWMIYLEWKHKISDYI